MQRKIFSILTIFIAFILVGCTTKSNEDLISKAVIDQTPETQKTSQKFAGEEGENLVLKNGRLDVNVEDISAGRVKYFNTRLADGKTIYFFIVRDKNGILRAAANACQVCNLSGRGFIQVGNNMKCQTCGNVYPLEKIATEKGGCNPGPINPDLKESNGKINITKGELQNVADLF